MLVREFLEDIVDRRAELLEEMKTRAPTADDEKRLDAYEKVLGAGGRRQDWLAEVEKALEEADDDIEVIPDDLLFGRPD